MLYVFHTCLSSLYICMCLSVFLSVCSAVLANKRVHYLQHIFIELARLTHTNNRSTCFQISLLRESYLAKKIHPCLNHVISRQHPEPKSRIHYAQVLLVFNESFARNRATGHVWFDECDWSETNSLLQDNVPFFQFFFNTFMLFSTAYTAPVFLLCVWNQPSTNKTMMIIVREFDRFRKRVCALHVTHVAVTVQQLLR